MSTKEQKDKAVIHYQDVVEHATGIRPSKQDVRRHLGERSGDLKPSAPLWLRRSLGLRPQGRGTDED